MGLTISSPNKSIDVSAAGFMRLRRRVAYCYDEELGRHYENLMSCETEEDYNNYSKKTNELFSNFLCNHANPTWLFSFLYASDLEGKLSYGNCTKLLKIIVDCDDNIILGYAGSPGCATMKDFKQILVDCSLNKRQMKWC